MSFSPARPLVSIIIPTYNRSHLLSQTLASVLAQTYTPLEIIVVDDGSTDETLTMLAQYEGRILLVTQANQGVAAARNHGTRIAKGHYLTFLDDDDLIEPTKIARQVALFQRQPELGLVHCGYYLSDKDGQLRDKVWLWPQADTLRQLICRNFIWSGAPLIRRDSLQAVGEYDSQLTNGQDWDLWLKLALAGVPFAVIPQPLGTYRLQPDSMVTNLTRLQNAVLTVLERAFAHPALPESVAAIKPEAYGGTHLWLSGRGYATGQWDIGQHHWQAAFQWRPEWQTQPGLLLPLWRNQALDIRVADPLSFVHHLFNHLPDEAGAFRPYKPQLLGQVQAELALRAYNQDKVKIGQHHWQQAVTLDPQTWTDPAAFIDLLLNHVMRLPHTDPPEWVEKVLHHWPLPAHARRKLRRLVLAKVHLACAFESYALDDSPQTLYHLLAAIRYGPGCLRNRGVLSILLRSLKSRYAR
ncbi:MAG: glycosyltransferase [Anaerolineae bacterium]|nr:glycosyltransferase [Anaerolineae bacterium]